MNRLGHKMGPDRTQLQECTGQTVALEVRQHELTYPGLEVGKV